MPVVVGRVLVPQFAWGDQLLLEPPPVQDEVAAEATDGLTTQSRMARSGTVRKIVRAVAIMKSIHGEGERTRKLSS